MVNSFTASSFPIIRMPVTTSIPLYENREIINVDTTGSVSFQSIYGSKVGDKLIQTARVKIPAEGISIAFTMPITSSSKSFVFTAIQVPGDEGRKVASISTVVGDYNVTPNGTINSTVAIGGNINHPVALFGNNIGDSSVADLIPGQTYFLNIRFENGQESFTDLQYVYSEVAPAKVDLAGSTSWETVFGTPLQSIRSLTYRTPAYTNGRIIPLEGISIAFTVPITTNTMSFLFYTVENTALASIREGSINQTVGDYTSHPSHRWGNGGSIRATVNYQHKKGDIQLVPGATYFFNVRNLSPKKTANYMIIRCYVGINHQFS